MDRRQLLTALTFAVAMAPGMARADSSFAERIESQLQKQGFTEIEEARTLLGRVRITASGTAGSREIILDPRTGEILRDYWVKAAGAPSGDGKAGGQSGNQSGGGIIDHDDDDDDRGGGHSGGSQGGNGGSGNDD